MARALPAAPAWAEVSLAALGHNLGQMRKLAAPGRVIAMVKANAYGHGLVPAARAFLKAGASALAVAFPAEGAGLRRAGVRAPILVVAPVTREGAVEALRARLIPQVSSYEGALFIERAAEKLGLPSVPVQVELDTGMGRVGFRPEGIFRDLGSLLKLGRLRLEGFYAHFATADWADPGFARRQAAVFRKVMEGVHFFTAPREKSMPTHLANSAALLTRALRAPAAYARPGLALYGVAPSPRLAGGLRPAMSLRARILHVKTVQKGDSVSYGRTWTAKRPTRVATLGLGYADGLHRSLSNRGHCLVRGKRVPLIGTICMDMAMADVSAVPGVGMGDTATLFGRDGKAFLGVEEQAAAAGTISYELLCAVGPRVPRLYGA